MGSEGDDDDHTLAPPLFPFDPKKNAPTKPPKNTKKNATETRALFPGVKNILREENVAVVMVLVNALLAAGVDYLFKNSKIVQRWEHLRHKLFD